MKSLSQGESYADEPKTNTDEPKVKHSFLKSRTSQSNDPRRTSAIAKKSIFSLWERERLPRDKPKQKVPRDKGKLFLVKDALY